MLTTYPFANLLYKLQRVKINWEIREQSRLTGSKRAEKIMDATEEMAAQMNRRIMKFLKDWGGGRRKMRVGA